MTPIEAAAKEILERGQHYHGCHALDDDMEKDFVAILSKHFPPAPAERDLPDAEGWWWERINDKWVTTQVQNKGGELLVAFVWPQKPQPGRWVPCPPPAEPLTQAPDIASGTPDVAPPAEPASPPVSAEGGSASTSREWTPKTLLEQFRSALPSMSDEERVEIFDAFEDGYCRHCGCVEPPGRYCQCTNDE